MLIVFVENEIQNVIKMAFLQNLIKIILSSTDLSNPGPLQVVKQNYLVSPDPLQVVEHVVLALHRHILHVLVLYPP